MPINNTGTSLATEDRAGQIKLATQAEVDAGVVDNKAVTPLTLQGKVGDVSADITALADRVEDLENGIAVPPGTPSQQELDATQTGAGLNADGSYTAPVGSNYLGAATSLKNADSLLDAQVKTNADAIAQLGAGNIANLQSEVDDSQASIGLDADGGFTANAGGNYIAGATTVRGEINALDAQLKSTQDDLDALETTVAGLGGNTQGELDATQAAVGLNADGSYSAHVGSNYIDAAATVKAALSVLDGKIKLNADDVAAAATAADLTTLQGEVDATQAGVGLNANGSFTAQAGTYIGGASNVRQEVLALDTAAASIQSELDAVETATGLGANGSLPAYSNSTHLGGAAVSHHAALGSLSSAHAAALTLLDTHESSIGLDPDGGYTAIANANYASDNTLKGAVTSLDTQLKSTQDDLDTLETTVTNLQVGAPNQAEVDAIETAVGLNTNGSYSAHTTSNYLNAATSVKGALGLLDAEIRSNELDIATLTTAITTANNTNTTQSTEIVALQTELDNTQAGAGLSAAGNYVAPGASNYLGTATTLKSADSLLDAQIKTNANAIATNASNISTNATAIATKAAAADVTALQTLADTHETSIGLTAAGAYQPPANSNYLAAATSVRDADSKLDARLKTNSDNISTNTTDIATNATDIATAEGNITNLQGRMTQAESDISDNATDIATNATAITSIQNVNTTQGTSITNLQSELDATQTGAGLGGNGAYTAAGGANYISAATSLKDADNKLDTQVKANADAISSNDTDITALQGRMTTAETDIAAAEADIAQLQTDIANVPTNNNLTSLQTEVDTIETAVGLNANGTKSNFTSTNYVTATSSFKVAIEELDTDIASAISSEASTRATADTALQALIDTHETSLGLNADGSRPAYSSTNYASGTHNNAIGALDTQVKSNADAISSNDTDITALQGRMTTAETDITSLEGDVATLQTSVAAKGSQTEVDAIESGVGLNADGSYTAIVGATYATDNTLKAALASVDSQVATNTSAISSNDTDISNLQTLADTHEASIGLSAAGAYISRNGTNYLGAATSIALEIGLLDTQIGTNESDISALETLADTHETAIGLNANGTYTAIAGANYATDNNIKAALASLDAQVKSNTDDIAGLGGTDIADINTLLDTHESSIGLDADGGYTAPNGTNYIDAATSVRNESVRLDTQVKTNADAITTEATARAAADAALDTRLDAREERSGGIFVVAGGDFEFQDDFMIKGHAGCWAYHVNYGAAGVSKDIEFYQAAPSQSTKMLKILSGGDAEFAG